MKQYTWALQGGITLFGLFGFLLGLPASASIEKSVTWSGMTPTELQLSEQRQYISSDNLLHPIDLEPHVNSVLDDPENRVNPEFRVPSDLRISTNFWLKIFTEFTTKHVVLFDEHHQELIYEVLDLRNLTPAKSTVLIQRKLDAYRRAFEALNSRPKRQRATAEERLILATIKKSKHRHTYREFGEHFKAQRGQRDNLMRGFLAAEPYFPKMEAIFSSMGVPKELTRLTLVESSFNFSALSSAGALGVWQFMEGTANEYLTLDERKKIDERLSPWKSTVAAGKLLLFNYDYLGNWVLAITAYNHGIRHLPRLKRARVRLGPEREYLKVAKLFRSSCNSDSPLGWASRNYYTEFLAVLHVDAYRTRFFGETPEISIRPVYFSQAPARKSGQMLAMESGVSLLDFKKLNPDIQDLKRPLPKHFLFALPSVQDDFRLLLKELGDTEMPLTPTIQNPQALEPTLPKKEPSS